MRDFRKYDLYKESLDFVDDIYNHTARFPNEEKYGIVSQITRAAVSIPCNIAEGASRSSEKDFRRFIEISIGSAFEVEVLIEISLKRKYLSEEASIILKEKLSVILKRLNTLKTKLTN